MSFLLQWFRAGDLFGSQIGETTERFELQINYKPLGIFDSNKHRARNHGSLKLDSIYLNVFFYPAIK